MMKKLLLLALCLLLLVGCAPALDPQYDKAEVIDTAKAFLSDLNERKYEDCADRFDGLMAAQFDAALLSDTMEQTLNHAGAFVRFKNERTASSTVGGVAYAVVMLTAEYENASIRYTVSLDPDLAVAGLYFK